MEGASINIFDRQLVIRLPHGYTVKELVHQKLGSHGVADPLDLREQVVINLKVSEEW